MDKKLTKASLLNALHIKYRHSEGSRFGTPKNLEKDWKIVLISFLVLCLLIILINLVVFYRVRKGEEIDGSHAQATSTIEIFNRSVLTKWSEEANNRRTQFLELETQKPEIADPSSGSTRKVEEVIQEEVSTSTEEEIVI